MNGPAADRKLPGTLLFLGVVAFLLGGLGLLGAATGFFGILIQQQQVSAIAPGSSGPLMGMAEPMRALVEQTFVP
jgi:hypothetical protein